MRRNAEITRLRALERNTKNNISHVPHGNSVRGQFPGQVLGAIPGCCGVLIRQGSRSSVRRLASAVTSIPSTVTRWR